MKAWTELREEVDLATGQLMKVIGSLPPEHKDSVGKALNMIRQQWLDHIDELMVEKMEVK